MQQLYVSQAGPRWNCSAEQEANEAQFAGIKVHSSEVGSRKSEVGAANSVLPELTAFQYNKLVPVPAGLETVSCFLQNQLIENSSHSILLLKTQNQHVHVCEVLL